MTEANPRKGFDPAALRSAVQLATQAQNVSVVEMLLRSGVEPIEVLHVAVDSGSRFVLEYLLRQRKISDINSPGEQPVARAVGRRDGTEEPQTRTQFQHTC
jgi:hypothetical protein